MPSRREPPPPTVACSVTAVVNGRVAVAEQCVLPLIVRSMLPQVRDHAYQVAHRLRLSVACPTLDALSPERVAWTMRAEDGSPVVLEYRCQP